MIQSATPADRSSHRSFVGRPCVLARESFERRRRGARRNAKTYVNALNHATLRRAPRGRPDLAGCLPRCIRTDGRVKLCAKTVPALAEPHILVQWVLKEEHAHQALGQRRRHQSIGWPIRPVLDRARPCECYATTAHVTAATVGVCWHHPRTEHLRLELCHQWCRTCDSPKHYWSFWSIRRELALGADVGCVVLL